MSEQETVKRRGKYKQYHNPRIPSHREQPDIVNSKLMHLSDCVKDWGPLWGYSTFGFENLNGYLRVRKYAHGTGNVLPQLVESFMMHQASNNTEGER